MFFSVYKGTNKNFVLDREVSDEIFNFIIPKMKKLLGDSESLRLLEETIDEKKRIIQGVRFPENEQNLCYLSMSERVISPSGSVYN
jgi:hypothetical protein